MLFRETDGLDAGDMELNSEPSVDRSGDEAFEKTLSEALGPVLGEPGLPDDVEEVESEVDDLDEDVAGWLFGLGIVGGGMRLKLLAFIKVGVARGSESDVVASVGGTSSGAGVGVLSLLSLPSLSFSVELIVCSFRWCHCSKRRTNHALRMACTSSRRKT